MWVEGIYGNPKRTNTHLNKDKKIPSLINKLLGNSKNNFNVFMDGVL